jgi:hypothetical protein
MKTMLLSILAVLLIPVAAASAITITPSGTTADVSYTEPMTNADATPLIDLDHCNVYAKPASGNEVKFPNVPASKATGGAAVKTNVSVAAGSNYTITVTCTDFVGNESARSAGVTLDALAPSAPK